MIAGGYSLDLYCDNAAAHANVHESGEFPHTYVAETGGECRRRARMAGWTLGSFRRPDGKDLCPKCSGWKTIGSPT